jgi:hypothetical protein
MTYDVNAGSSEDQIWAGALQAWGAGNFALAFHFCQGLLARGRKTHEVYALLGAVALGLGRYDKAMDYTALAEAARPKDRPARRRYIVIQPWGCGFWGEIDHVLGQLAVAEITGRTPVVHWGGQGVYPAPGHDNAWEAYFEPVSDVHLDDIRRVPHSYYPGWWEANNVATTSVEVQRGSGRMSSLYALSAGEDVVVADCHNRMLDILAWAPAGHWLATGSARQAYEALFAKYIRLRPHLRSRVDEAVARLGPGPIIAVHYRAQSKGKIFESGQADGLEPSDYYSAIDLFLRNNPSGTIFLLTDLKGGVDAFAARYGARLRILPAHRLDDASEADLRWKAGTDLRMAAEEVIIDAYVAARCDAFVGDGASGVSCAIGYLKQWAPETFVLLRDNVFLQPGRIHYHF